MASEDGVARPPTKEMVESKVGRARHVLLFTA